MAPLTCCCGFYAWEKGLIDDDEELFMEAFGDESSSVIHTEPSTNNPNNANVAIFQAPLEDNNDNFNHNHSNFNQSFMK
jgi:hypothetical protein